MKENAIKKINKVGKIGNVLTKICKVFVIIGIVGALIGAVVCFALPKDLISVGIGGNAKVSMDFAGFAGAETVKKEILPEIKKSLEDDRGRIELDDNQYVLVDITAEDTAIVMDMNAKADKVITLRTIALACTSVVVYLIVVLITLIFIGKLCKAVRDCSSPFEENVIVNMKKFAFSLIPWVLVDSVFEALMTFFLGKSGDISVGVNVGMLVVVLVVFALVYVFQYGAVLQQESDETL